MLNPKEAQKLFGKYYDINEYLTYRIESYIAKHMNDNNIHINISTITFLNSELKNTIRVKLQDVDINDIKTKTVSNIKAIELGFSYSSFFRNILSKKEMIPFDYIDVKNLTLNAVINKNGFVPGPLMRIFSGANNLHKNKIIKMNGFKHLFQKDIFIGKIKLILLDKRNFYKNRLVNINCNKVFISKYIQMKRNFTSVCQDETNLNFSIEGTLTDKGYLFEGYFQNLKPEIIIGNPLNYNGMIFKSTLNGNYSLKTERDFIVKQFQIISNGSSLDILNKKKKTVTKDLMLLGNFLWNNKKNELNLKNISIDNIKYANGYINFKNRRGVLDLNIEKIALKKIKLLLNKDYFLLNKTLNLGKAHQITTNLNRIKGGMLKNVSVRLEFILENDFGNFQINKIDGKSNFINIKYQNSNSFFKKVSSLISGNLKFKIGSQKFKTTNKKNWIELDIKASNGFVLLKKSLLKYKFDNALINLKITPNSFNISKVDFYKKSILEYSFKDFEIVDEMLINGSLNFKLNKKLLKILENQTGIEIKDISNISLLINGDIKKENYQVNLNGNLTKSSFKIPFINLSKKKNKDSSINLILFIKKGRIKSINNINLNIEDNNIKLDLIHFDYDKKNKLYFKNIQSKNINLNEIKLTEKNNNFEFKAFGKFLNLSKITENVQKNSLTKSKKIIFDITAKKIILDRALSISGNLKGQLNYGSLNAVAVGKMWLGKLSILDTGKLNISVNNKFSNLNGIGLVGGAETKIILKKNKDMYPILSFETTDGGKLLSALDFTNKVRSGKMNITINFLDDLYSSYDGIIEGMDFSLIDAPGIINSLSVLSFSGIESVITGEGVSFSRGKVKFYVKDNIFNFDPLLLSSESLGIKARGKLDLSSEFIDLRGSVAPIKIISQIISIVPAVGDLITGLKKDGLFAGQFKMIGDLKDPKTTLNTLSFAPGIFREIFSNDWLDQNNFFVKNKSN